MKIKIHTDQQYDCSWRAVTENYDGAPDAGLQFVGEGNSKQEAIDDLMKQIEDK